MKKIILFCILAVLPGLSGFAQKSIVFPGSTSCYGSIGDNAALNLAASKSLTITAWIKTSISLSNQVFLAKRNGAGTIGYELWSSGGKFAVNCTHTNSTSSGLTTSTHTISDGKWHHVAFVIDNTNAKYFVYVDGEIDQTKALASTAGVTNTRNLYFGVRDGSSLSLPWTGNVDEVRFYNKALSDVELATDRATTVTASTSNLSAAWGFEEGVIPTIADVKGVNNATITGLPTWSTLNTKWSQTITLAGPVTTYLGTADFSPATSTSPMPIEYQISDPSVATVVSGKIHIVGKGSCTITASQSANLFYDASNVVIQTLTVGKTLVSINLPFTNHAVVQRGQEIRVSGKADANDVLTVILDGETKPANVNVAGNWSCTFSAKAAKSTAFTLSASGANSQQNTITDLLCGDVWVAAGQSNMQMSLDGTNWSTVTNGSSEIANANYPNIRLIRPVDMWQQASTPQTQENTFNGGWQVCSPSTVGGYTAVGYFLARQLFQDQNIPIGIIQAAVGGTRIEAWTPLAGLQSISEYAGWYTKATTTNLESGQTYNRKNFPTGNYNGMIAPFTHNPVKGIIWYQGEENLGQDIPSAQYEYGNKFKATIQSWRTVWNIADLPVIFTELANYPYNSRWATGIDALPKFIVQQRTATKLANVYGITISDISDFTNIHPANKQDVGARMGNIALQHIYGKNIEATPATFKEMKSEGSALRVTFNNNSNLHLSNGTVINEFQVAGEDKVYKIATAILNNNDVLVSEPTITHPLYIKYAWGENSNPNLFNASNTPTSRFTDSLKLNQLIFTAIPATFKAGDSNLTLQATATSGLPVTFVSSNPNVATIVNGQLNIVGEGSANITAAEPGNTTYAAAVPVVQTINVISATALSNHTVSTVKLRYNKTQCAVIAQGVSAGDSIRIFSSAGAILASKIATDNECILQLNQPSTDTYLICISNANESTTFKLTI